MPRSNRPRRKRDDDETPELNLDAIRAGIKCVWTHLDDTKATLVITRDGVERKPFTFTMEDARRAGLAGSLWSSAGSILMKECLGEEKLVTTSSGSD
jgi:hypothetical protein